MRRFVIQLDEVEIRRCDSAPGIPFLNRAESFSKASNTISVSLCFAGRPSAFKFADGDHFVTSVVYRIRGELELLLRSAIVTLSMRGLFDGHAGERLAIDSEFHGRTRHRHGSDRAAGSPENHALKPLAPDNEGPRRSCSGRFARHWRSAGAPASAAIIPPPESSAAAAAAPPPRPPRASSPGR